MGAGQFPGGSFEGGQDASNQTSAPTVLDNPAAYDPTNRVVPLNTAMLASDGSAPVKTKHWVDTSVAIRLSVFKGDLPADQTIGLDKHRLASATPANAARVTSSVVHDALADLIAKNTVDIDAPGLGVFLSVNWRQERQQFDVKYRNLLDPNNASLQPQTFSVGKGVLF